MIAGCGVVRFRTGPPIEGRRAVVGVAGEPAGWWPALDAWLAAAAGIVDRVELKVVLEGADDRRLLERARGEDVSTARRSRVYFFDTPYLDLRARGVLVRARRRGTGGDVVVKLRVRAPDAPSTGPPVPRGPVRRVELDVLPGSAWCSTAIRQRVGASLIARVASGQAPVSSLLTVEQYRWLDRHANPAPTRDRGRTEVGDLVATGPIEVTRTSLALPGVIPPVTVEDWAYPDDSRLLELSTKCRPERAAARARATSTALTDLGLTPRADQPTKADVSLAFFFP